MKLTVFTYDDSQSCVDIMNLDWEGHGNHLKLISSLIVLKGFERKTYNNLSTLVFAQGIISIS